MAKYGVSVLLDGEKAFLDDHSFQERDVESIAHGLYVGTHLVKLIIPI